MDGRAFGIGADLDAQAPGRPARRLRVQVGERFGRFLPLCFQGVHAQIERRARGQRLGLLGTFIAEACGELVVQPFGIVAAHMGGCSLEASCTQPRVLVIRERLGRKACAVAQRRNRLDIEVAFARQHPEQHRARRFGAHDPGRRRLAAQRVIDEARNGGAIPRAGEAMREAPVLQRLRGGAAARLDIGKDFDRGREPCARGHGSASRMRIMKMTHITIKTIAPMP